LMLKWLRERKVIGTEGGMNGDSSYFLGKTRDCVAQS
jgi:hypothetical protein